MRAMDDLRHLVDEPFAKRKVAWATSREAGHFD